MYLKQFYRIRTILLFIGTYSFLNSCLGNVDKVFGNETKIESHHPFLIVKREQFPELRARSFSEPWLSMKEDAILRSENGCKTEPYDLQYYVGVAALAYILDEANAQVHANRVRDAILNQYSKIEVKEGGNWNYVVPPLGSLFMAILCLDIVYDDLTVNEIEKCEAVILRQMSQLDKKGSWQDVRSGTFGTWDIYKGKRNSPDNDYYNGIMKQITEDGVSPVTIHYAWERVGGGDSRLSKSGYMDVLEFTGIDSRYYNNEKLQKFQRWLFGSSVNCSKEMAIIGDMLPTQGINNDLLHRRVVNFDTEAAGYAAWFHEGVKARGNILSYILPKSPLPKPVVPGSKIYKNGGAFLREKNDDPNGLHLVLYNIMSQDEWHTHEEANGLALSGYGNRLLVNGGRLGEPTRAASLNNTLTVGGENHASRLGGGIVEGFTADVFDYAKGFSGDALPENNHYRSVILVHGLDLAKGYSVVFDELGSQNGNQVKNYLHPANETEIIELKSKTEYIAEIDHKQTLDGAKLSVFYATPPVEVNIDKVPSAVPNRYPDYPDHNRLESVYEAGLKNEFSLATILFPYNNNHQKPPITRILDDNYSGAVINHSEETTDIVIESSGEESIIYEDISFQAKSVVCRNEINGLNNFYFVREGLSFSRNDVGFESDKPITIYIGSSEGLIISKGARVKLIGYKTSDIQFDDGAEIIDSGPGFIVVKTESDKVHFSL